MDQKTRIATALKTAMKNRETDRLPTLRLISAAIKDRDIAVRGTADEGGVGDTEVLQILGKMVKQRQESIRAYEEGGRLELADAERAEIELIEEFLPRKLSDDETGVAIDAAIAEEGATSLRDMGRVMALLKARHTGQLDFGTVGPTVKDRLSTSPGS